jgi:PTH1 family peptidyl-tRNA hydrolase
VYGPEVMTVENSSLRLIVGLGNPGRGYRNNRHNLGFMVVEEMARRLGLVLSTAASTFAVAADRCQDPGIVLLKPMSYMNLSGQAVLDWSRQAGVALTGRPLEGAAETDADGSGVVSPEEISAGVRPLVVCDDLNLPLGSVRLRSNGSSGGQNGLASVIEHLGGEEFPRLRLGIAPLTGEIDPEAWPGYVTADFEPDERAAAEDLVDHAATALVFWLDHGLEAAISRFNRRIRPPVE